MSTKNSKLKTARAVEPNVGTRNTFAKRLYRVNIDFNVKVNQQILAHLESLGFIVGDDSLSNPRDEEQKRKVLKLQAKILKSLKNNPQWATKSVQSFIRAHAIEWLTEFDVGMEKVCQWFVRTTMRDVTSSQRRALVAAGFPPDYFKTRWTVPTVRGQYVSSAAFDRVPRIVSDMTGLITRMKARDLLKLQEVIIEGIANGQDIGRIERTLSQFEGFDYERCSRVALDQSNKISQAIQAENAQALGITDAIWIHVPGRYSSRETHIKMNNKPFRLSEGLYDEEVKRYVKVGELPYCRCVARMIIPEGL